MCEHSRPEGWLCLYMTPTVFGPLSPQNNQVAGNDTWTTKPSVGDPSNINS